MVTMITLATLPPPPTYGRAWKILLVWLLLYLYALLLLVLVVILLVIRVLLSATLRIILLVLLIPLVPKERWLVEETHLGLQFRVLDLRAGCMCMAYIHMYNIRKKLAM